MYLLHRFVITLIIQTSIPNVSLRCRVCHYRASDGPTVWSFSRLHNHINSQSVQLTHKATKQRSRRSYYGVIVVDMARHSLWVSVQEWKPPKTRERISDWVKKAQYDFVMFSCRGKFIYLCKVSQIRALVHCAFRRNQKQTSTHTSTMKYHYPILYERGFLMLM